MSEKFTPTTLVANRNFTLSTTKGHSIAFKKGVPQHVPPIIYQEALAAGAVPPDGMDVQVKEDVTTDNTPSDPSDRAPAIMAAIEKLVAENSRDNFTAAGSPTVDAVTRVVGYKVQAKEIATVWQVYHDKMAEARQVAADAE